MSISTLALLCALVGTINFNTDVSVFRGQADSGRIELFYAIPYGQLNYTLGDSGLAAHFRVTVDVAGLENGFRQQGVMHKRARVASFQEAERAQRSFVDGFSVAAPPGRYRLEVTVSESAAAAVNEGLLVDTVEIPSFSAAPALSSLQLGASVVEDSATGAVSVVPNPTHRFGVGGLDVVYVYFEGYNLRPETSQYAVRLAVVKRAGDKVDTVSQTKPMVRGKSGTATASALGVSLDGVAAGAYTLEMELTDLAAGKSVTGERRFSVGSADTATSGPVPRLSGLTDPEQRHYRDIQYIASARELAYYKALSDSGKEAWLASFWAKHNLTEFARRMDVAASRYSLARTPGIKTDRGRIYVKYGEPDAIEQKVIETDVRPREYWRYDGTGYIFVFIDIRGDGTYRLAWTNCKDEPRTGLESNLTDEEQDQFNIK